MTQQNHATPDDAEAAFYEAFERGDLDAMMAVWADHDDIVCIHPLGTRLQGRDAVRTSWKRIFAGSPNLRFRVREQHITEDESLSVHLVYEYIDVAEKGRRSPPVLATNIYQHTGDGWKMILHHASPSGGTAQEAAPAPPSKLH